MPRKRPISDNVGHVKDLTDDTNQSPEKGQKSVTSRWEADFPNLDIPQQSTDSTPSVSRKRPLSDILHSSLDEETQLKGEPTMKKSKNVPSDFMMETLTYMLKELSDSEIDSNNDTSNSFVEDKQIFTSTEHAKNKTEVACSKPHTKIIYQDEINVNDGSVECLSTKPCKKHEPADPDIIYPNPKYEPYYLPQLEETPLMCDGELRTFISSYYQQRDQPTCIIQQFAISRPCKLNITLYTDEIKTLFQAQQKDIHLSRTVNVGPCYMTMFVLRQKNLINKSTKTKLPPLIVGPVLLHFDRSYATYSGFLHDILFEFDLPRDNYRTTKGVPKNDRPLVQAMRTVFGSCMELAGRQHSTGNIRRNMHYGCGRIKYNAPFVAVVNYIHEQIYDSQSECMRKALFGERTEDYALTERAREHASQWIGCSGAYQKFLELVPE